MNKYQAIFNCANIFFKFASDEDKELKHQYELEDEIKQSLQFKKILKKLDEYAVKKDDLSSLQKKTPMLQLGDEF